MKMKTRDMILIAVFAVLTAVGAQIMVPVPFVPFTLQTLVTMSAGLLLGAKRGAASQALYMFMGLAGLPVFTGGGGPASVFAPSFGYIPGFIVCAAISGAIVEKLRAEKGDVTFLQYFAASMAGTLALYVIGVAYLYVILNFWMSGKAVGVIKVIQIGFLSTIGVDFVKAAVASVIAKRLNGRVKI